MKLCRVSTKTVAVLLVLAWAAQAQPAPRPPWNEMRARARGILETALSEETEWVRVHAAEALLRNGYPAGVAEAFAAQADTAPPKHRIGVWRVLAQAQSTEAAREVYVARIRQAFLDPDGPDRLHAVETLAKLADPARPDELLRVGREGTGALQTYARFALARSGGTEDEAALAALLGSDDAAVGGGAAYGLRFLEALGPDTFARLDAAARAEAADSTARVYLFSARYVHAPEDDVAAAREALLRYARDGSTSEKFEVGAALARRGDDGDVPLLLGLIEDPEADVRISGADALLEIERRTWRPYAHREGFEGECPDVALWAKNGASTAAFLGPTEEEAYEGARSFKLDVGLEGGSYHYFGAPLIVPCAGRLRLTARVLVAEGTTARVGFGTNMRYPPTHHSGCGPARDFDKPTGGWELVEMDLAARGEQGASGVMGNYTATVRGEDVGAYLDRWSLFIRGGAGKRAVVYVDDIRVEGEGPTEDDYRDEVERRWQKGQARLEARVDEWRRQVSEGERVLAALPEAGEAVQADVDAIKGSVAKAREQVEAFADRGYGSKQELNAIESALFITRYGPETIRTIAAGLASRQPYLTYTPEAISNRQLATSTFPIPARVGTKLACAGCRGEYESVTLAVYALEDVQGMLVTVSDLEGTSGAIPSDAVDVHVVKSWYQAGVGIWPNTKVFVPELLLKDDRLIRVDREREENHVRSTAADGAETYLPCSGPTSEDLEGVRPIDAAELQPVDVPKRTLQQFWITVHVPDDVEAGTYRGEVLLKTAAGATSLPFEVTVHPFDLAAPSLTYSIYYRAKLSEDGQPTIGSEYKSEEQYRAEIQDFAAHGVPYPTNYQGWDEARLRRVLEIRRDAGLPAGRFYTLGRQTGSATDAPQLAQLSADVKGWIEFCRPFGYDEVYFYGTDEARGERLAAQRAAWRTVQEAGGKTFVACYKGTFEAMGDLLDCAVLAGRPDPREAEKWHGAGSEAFCYAYPQVGNEEPETYRRNFGLLLWKAGFDGAMDYAYQHGFGHIWNDFDHGHYRDHNFTYPTVNGVVGTIQWEGFREAVDDVRYVTTLEHAIEHAPPDKADAAAQARRWLDELDPETADLYAARERMAAFIAELL